MGLWWTGEILRYPTCNLHNNINVDQQNIVAIPNGSPKEIMTIRWTYEILRYPSHNINIVAMPNGSTKHIMRLRRSVEIFW